MAQLQKEKKYYFPITIPQYVNIKQGFFGHMFLFVCVHMSVKARGQPLVSLLFGGGMFSH